MGKYNQKTKHHRRPRSKGGSNADWNISIVPIKKHEAWHILFGNLEADEIVKEINKLWIDPDYEIIAVYKEKVTFRNH